MAVAEPAKYVQNASAWILTISGGVFIDQSGPCSKACPHFVDSYNETTAQYCMLETQIPDEPVGYTGALDWLPGCVSMNPVIEAAPSECW